jgi:NAD(P)-dependent dehydrogenase (short-subunit alcohol dehydrogenase family)
MSMLRGKQGVVTGVTSGIGKALVARLIEEGARVVGLARKDDLLRELATTWGEAFVPIVADLAVPEERAAAQRAVLAAAPRVDFLVNNAAEVVYASPLALPLERWRRLIEIDLVAAIELVQALAPAMPADGHVVNLSSVTARFVSQPAFGPYALAKTALESFSDALRLELAPRGVAVTVVRPGLVDTPLYGKVEGFEKSLARLREAVPEWLRAEDVADAIVWVLSRPRSVVVGELTILPRHQAR